MALPTAETFISPVGDLTEEMFPGEDLEERVDGYLSAITPGLQSAIVGDDDKLERAVLASVYARAFRAAAAKAVGEPIMGNLVDQGSVQYAQDRARQFLDLAELYQKDLDAILGSLETTVIPVRFPSGAVPTRITAP